MARRKPGGGGRGGGGGGGSATLSAAAEGTLIAISKGGISGAGSMMVPSPEILKTPGFRFSTSDLLGAKSVEDLVQAGLITTRSMFGNSVQATITEKGRRVVRQLR